MPPHFIPTIIMTPSDVWDNCRDLAQDLYDKIYDYHYSRTIGIPPRICYCCRKNTTNHLVQNRCCTPLCTRCFYITEYCFELLRSGTRTNFKRKRTCEEHDKEDCDHALCNGEL